LRIQEFINVGGKCRSAHNPFVRMKIITGSGMNGLLSRYGKTSFSPDEENVLRKFDNKQTRLLCAPQSPKPSLHSQ
jgi:hypothetical protein